MLPILLCLWAIASAILLPPRDNTNYYANVSEVPTAYWGINTFYPGGGGNVHCLQALDLRGNIIWGWGTSNQPVSYTYVAVTPQGQPIWSVDLYKIFGFAVNGGCPDIWSTPTETRVFVSGTAQGSTPFTSYIMAIDGLTGKVLASGPVPAQNPTQCQYWYGKFVDGGEKVLVYCDKAMILLNYPSLEPISQTPLNTTDRIGTKMLSSVNSFADPQRPGSAFIAAVYGYTSQSWMIGFGVSVWRMDSNGALTLAWDSMIDMAVTYPQAWVVVGAQKLFVTCGDTAGGTQFYSVPISETAPISKVIHFPIASPILVSVLPTAGIVVTGGQQQNPMYFYNLYNGKLLYNQTFNFTGKFNAAVSCSFEDRSAGLTYCLYNDVATRTSSNMWLRIFTTFDGTRIAESILMDRKNFGVTNPSRLVVARGSKGNMAFIAEVSMSDVYQSSIFGIPIVGDHQPVFTTA